MEVYMIDLSKEICKQVLKLDFTAHGLLEPLSEFQPRTDQIVDMVSWLKMVPLGQRKAQL
jgi:hypothetical protein